MTIATSCMQGWRETMEDVEIIQPSLHPSIPETCCVGVFDGHGGSAVSKAAANTILKELFGTKEFKNDPQTSESLTVALCKAFISTDEALRENPEIGPVCDEVGSTGLVAIITPTDIVVANVGDSRCILSNTKCIDMIQLSMDHKPDVDFEKQRILSAGGTVFRGRVCGGVAVSRSFGDFWFKRNAAMKPHQQLVTAEPCIRLHRRSADDEFLFLACDGIYDVMTNEQIRKFVQKKTRQGTKSSAQDICEELINECLVKGSRDNMSVILVLFNDRGGPRSGGNNSFGVKSTIFRKK
ncbi:hypothetical protein ABG067_001127 [Albugo candida]